MSDACIPQDPHDRARLACQSYARMRARMLSIRARRAGASFVVVNNHKRGPGNPDPGAPIQKGGDPPSLNESARITTEADGAPSAHPILEGRSRCDVTVSSS